MSLLKLSGIGKIYYSEGSVAVGIRGIDLSFERGEFVAVTGASGSGKSTLLNVISGMDSYEEGELYIEGAPTSHYLESDWEEYRSKYISFIFQDYNILESYTVLQNVELALMHIKDRRERRRRAIELLTRVGMEKHLRQKGSKLSGGQKQRTVIARALAKDSPIILADEPTGNLDEATSKEIIDLLREVSKDKLLIIVTHNYEEVEGVATRHIRIYDGSVEFDRGEKPATVTATEEKKYEYVPPKKKKFSFKEFLRDLGDGIKLGGHVFASRPKLAVFTCMLMAVGMLGVFFITSTCFDPSVLEEFSYDMFEYQNGRVVAVRRDGALPTEDEISALAEKHSAQSYISCDFLLDKPLTINFTYDPYDQYYRYNSRNQGVFMKTVGDVDFSFEGELPDEAGEVLLSLPLHMEKTYRHVAIGEDNVYIEGISFKVTGISYYIDNNLPARVFVTEDEYNTMSHIVALKKMRNNQGIYINGVDKYGNPQTIPAYDLAIVRELGKQIYVPEGMGYDLVGPASLNVPSVPGCSLDLGDDAVAKSLPDYMDNFDMYYIPAIGMDAVQALADYYVENDYGQFSLFFKNDAEAKRAANKMLKEGYIAVLSDSQYEPDPFEKFAMGFLVFLMVAIWLGGVIGLAFFIRLCQSRSIVSFKNDIAIMRSMGIKAAVIKISMYMRSVIAVIPAAAGLFVVAALIFTSSEFNGYFTYLYGWQYALICFGLLLIAIRVSFKQQGKLFEGSVKKTLTGGELND
ncbi:MAG: ATP-binding cassette domain-containing protein [Clostridia bacterium]|nr:ATP-binding cassette domain-containing protein [Clostridia bacterium]